MAAIDDVQAAYVALDRFKVLAWDHRYSGMSSDIELADSGLKALERLRRYVQRSVPVAQPGMFGEGQ